MVPPIKNKYPFIRLFICKKYLSGLITILLSCFVFIINDVNLMNLDIITVASQYIFKSFYNCARSSAKLTDRPTASGIAQNAISSKSLKFQYSHPPPAIGLRIINGNLFCASSSSAIKYPSIFFSGTFTNAFAPELICLVR